MRCTEPSTTADVQWFSTEDLCTYGFTVDPNTAGSTDAHGKKIVVNKLG